MVVVVLVCDDDDGDDAKNELARRKSKAAETNSGPSFPSRFPSMLFPDPYVYPFLHVCAICMLCVVSSSIHPYALSHSFPVRDFVAKNKYSRCYAAQNTETKLA